MSIQVLVGHLFTVGALFASLDGFDASGAFLKFFEDFGEGFSFFDVNELIEIVKIFSVSGRSQDLIAVDRQGFEFLVKNSVNVGRGGMECASIPPC